MQEVQQDEHYKLLLNLFLSEETLDVDFTSDSSITNLDEVVEQYPMLKRFVGHKDKITKPKLIGNGQQGFVFKFKHNERDLCLKLFYEFKGVYDDEEVTSYISPFGCESRAFARLCDLHQNGQWAVRCHGWMYLTDSQLQQLWEVSRPDPRWHGARWAIVKDFIAEEPPSREDENFQNVMAKFHIPKCGRILPRDVKKENYRGDLIVDLGSTVTFPFYRRYARWTEHIAFFQDLDTERIPEWDQ
ncbi:kinetochore Sim4 complex subunit FTA2-domain-containing protein [Aspergillus avenaceus]|uniref:Kinetochore Sim4 complex subunit FTA2-domain-containing protein n=1 Tax=Aspergillus avenaceus TaxID=36643 RepID=A0A5N6U0M6_ASPAV|nr:kinetochore Sim4 complex subunit FTA2-domain-containing protein [Aspergillus avenaceus]